MEPDADLAAIGRLIGDPNRACILQVLMSGSPHSGSALAEMAGISRSLASAHLKQLTAGGLVRAERRGRQQLYSLASGQVAEALETLQLLAPAQPVRSLRGSTRMRNLRWARMCYDHLAGITGVSAALSRGLPAGVRARLPLVLAVMHLGWGTGFLTSPRRLHRGREADTRVRSAQKKAEGAATAGRE